MDKVNRRKTDNIALFSIGVKLVTIVTLIVLVSLGSITALVSWLVRQDLSPWGRTAKCGFPQTA
jgi:hypothetical protein